MRFDYVLKTLGHFKINIKHDWECLCVRENKNTILHLYLLHVNSICKTHNKNMHESQLLIIWDSS